jgi:hypothetical protein
VEDLVEDFVNDGGVIAGAGGDDVIEELVEIEAGVVRRFMPEGRASSPRRGGPDAVMKS